MVACWFAGLTTLDIVHRIARHPGPDEKITACSQEIAAGGPAANAAVVARALGAEATLLTALGDGPVADLARVDLHAHGVDPIDLANAHELSVSSVLVGPGGNRAVVSTDAGTPALGRLDLGALSDPAAVLLDGHHPDLQRAALAEARSRGAVVILDAGRWRPIFAELLPHADIVACSADFRLGPDCGPATDEALAQAILACGARAVVVTHGPEPVYWSDGAREDRVTVPEVPVRDTLGAGDAFHGALTAAIAAGVDLPSAVVRAVRVASTRVQYDGPRAYLEQMR